MNSREDYDREIAEAVAGPEEPTMSTAVAEGGPSGVLPVCAENRKWLDGHESGADNLLTMQRLREENPRAVFALTNAVQKDTQRKILAALTLGLCGSTYEELDKYLTVSKRTQRKHVKKLEENGIVERVDSRSTAISFVSNEMEVLAAEMVSLYHSQH